MRLVTTIFLALTLLFQPMLAQASALAACSRVPANELSQSVSPRMPCCGMMAPGEKCNCPEKSARGCECSVSSDSTPVVPERSTSPVPEVHTFLLLPVLLALAPHADEVERSVLRPDIDGPPKQSADSIQSLLCVWLT